MEVSIGSRLPEAKLMQFGLKGPEEVSLNELIGGENVVIFAVPGAFTPTCSVSHVPSFVRNASKLSDKGITKIICISVNDPFVLQAWEKNLDIKESGILLLGDAEGEFIRAIGMEFSAPAVGLVGRSKRFTMYVEDGVVKQLNVESNPGVCEISAAETLLKQI
ncbi:MAG: peroxiredoxin [Rhodobacteraceae bacterium]|nr:peroxiredoxin [Paracoccaceae bacterium]